MNQQESNTDLAGSLGAGDAAAVLKAGMKCAEVRDLEINGVPHLLLPEGMRAENFEKLLPKPLRIGCSGSFEEPDSFCDYVAIFRNPQTRLYGNPDKYSFRAILDDHLPGDPSWRTHTADLELKLSPEWNAWAAAFEGAFTQQELFEFLDDHMEQIASPDGGELLSGISTINIDNNWKCTSVQKEGGDISFAMAKENTAKTATGKIPSRLTLCVAPFRSWHPISMTVHLAYRLGGEKLTFTMKGHRMEELLAQSWHEVRNHVQGRLSAPVLV